MFNPYAYARSLALALLLLPLLAPAAILTVTTGADSGAGSLRAQIAAAASGDTIVFDGAVTTVALTSGQIAVGAKDLTINGGGTVTIDGSGNSHHGLLFNSSTRTWVLDGLTFDGFTASSNNGGAVLVTPNDWNLTVQNCTFSNNSLAASQGAGLGLQGQRWLATIDNCTFTNNRTLHQSRNGAAIFMDSGSGGNVATCVIRDCTFDSNLAGGHGGGILTNDVTVDIDDCIFTSNEAGNIGNGGEGGAIFFTTNRTNMSTIDDCQFIGNIGRQGGALRFNNRCMATMTSCVFTGNTSSGGNGNGGGGACFYGSNSTSALVTDVVFDSCTFSGNLSNDNTNGDGGGAARQTGGAWTFRDCIFSGNQATNPGSDIEGGALDIDDNTGLGVGYGGLCLVDGCRFIMNQGDVGGAILARIGTTVPGYAPTLTVRNSEFDQNSSTYTGTDNGIGGGAIMGYHGGASEAAKIIIEDSTFTQNSAQSGGACMIRGPFEITGSTFTSNSATRNNGNAGGGAIRFQGEDDNYTDSTRLIEDCTFTSNTAEVGPAGGSATDGGAIFSNTFSWTMRRCTFDGNRAYDFGGGIYTTGNAYTTPPAAPSPSEATVTIEDCTFTNNVADQGGGLHLRRNSTVSRCTFDSNSTLTGVGSFASGAAIMIGANPSNTIVQNCTITGNTSEDSAALEVRDGGTTNVYNCTIVNNTTLTNGRGGGIRAAGAAPFIHVYSSIIADNSDPNGGGDEDIDGNMDTFENNLIRDVNGFQVGGVNTPGSIPASNVQGADPLLGALQNNGGITSTMEPSQVSPVIDVGSNVNGLTGDQRGAVFPRNIDHAATGGAGPDIGAVELAADDILDFTVGASPNITLRLSSSGNNYEIVSDASGTVIASQTVATTNSLDLNGSGVGNTLTVDFSNGDPLTAAGGTDWDGGVDVTSDGITVTGGSHTVVTYTALGASNGTIDYDGSTMTYQGLEPIVDNGSASTRVFTVNLAGGHAIDISTPSAGNTTVAGPTFENVTFANPTTSLTINTDDPANPGNDGDNTVTMNRAAGANLFGVTVNLTAQNGGDDTITFDAQNGWAVDSNPGGDNGTISGHLFTINYSSFSTKTLNNVDATLVPTLTQWGITILFLLIASVGMIQIARQNGAEFASASVPLDHSVFRLWAGRCAIALLAFWTGCILILGHIPLSDLIGGAICLPALAYFLHLIQLLTPQLATHPRDL